MHENRITNVDTEDDSSFVSNDGIIKKTKERKKLHRNKRKFHQKNFKEEIKVTKMPSILKNDIYATDIASHRKIKHDKLVLPRLPKISDERHEIRADMSKSRLVISDCLPQITHNGAIVQTIAALNIKNSTYPYANSVCTNDEDSEYLLG